MAPPLLLAVLLAVLVVQLVLVLLLVLVRLLSVAVGARTPPPVDPGAPTRLRHTPMSA